MLKNNRKLINNINEGNGEVGVKSNSNSKIVDDNKVEIRTLRTPVAVVVRFSSVFKEMGEEIPNQNHPQYAHDELKWAQHTRIIYLFVKYIEA